MGEVYLADDTILRRSVAVKVLTADYAQSEERLRRFEREAYSASSLNHPNIVTIYEIGSEGGTNFIATEYVDGESLRLHMKVGQMELREVIDVAIQIVSALTTAHEAGIVHRDIKPENIMLRRDGYVKVLDFGLAKLAHDGASVHGSDDGEAPTHVLIKTEPGRVMGTVNYMSPEQARGREVDARTDIFSLGITIYEMVSGRRPFTGETQNDVLAAILRAEPEPLKKISPSVPAELNRIVSKALRKDREERYQSVKELWVDLKSLRQELDFDSKMARDTSGVLDASGRATTMDPTSGQTVTASQAETNPTTFSGLFINEVKSHPRRSTVTLAVIALAIAAGIFGLYRLIKLAQRPDSFQTMRLAKLTSSGDVSGGAVAVSPDGKYVAYATAEAGEESLWVRHVATSSTVQIVPPVEGGYTGLTFSRDGSYLYYTIEEKQQPDIPKLYQVPVLGGTPRKLIEDAHGTVTFSADGARLVFTRGADAPLLMIANADGTGVQTLATLPSRESWLAPAWSPDGRLIMAGVYSRADNRCRLVEVAVKDGTLRPLAAEPWLGVFRITWLPDGTGLVVNGRDLETKLVQIWLVSYPEGKTRRVTNDLSSYLGASLTTDGNTLASIQGARVTNLWIAPSGDANLAQKITFETGKDVGLSGLDWTPDGRIVYTSIGVGTIDLRIVDRNGSNSRQLTFTAGKNFFPCVTSDSRYIFFVSDRTGSNNIWRIDLDGSNPKQLTNVPGIVGGPTCSRGGNSVLYRVQSEENITVWRTTVDGSAPTQLTTEHSTGPAVSPDGKLLACAYGQPNSSTPVKLAILPIEGGPPARLLDLPNVIKAGSFRWSADGRALIYRDSRNRVDNLWSQPLDGSPAKQLTDFKSDQIFGFAWSHDGKVLALARGRDASDVVLISNFR
jgi:eukaryotic-like serine/threonine-protein kinase